MLPLSNAVPPDPLLPLMVATTLVDLLFIELMSHLSQVKQMYGQPINFTHELLLCIQITRGKVDFSTEIPQQLVLAGTKFGHIVV